MSRRPAPPVGAEHDLVHDPIVDGGEKLFLRTDVVVEGTLPELGRLTELDRARVVVAPLGKDFGGEVDDGLTAQVPSCASRPLVLCLRFGHSPT